MYQHPPGGKRTSEEEEAFKRALDIMADVYASAVGTTVLQIKEIPPRPAEFDGALCLFGLEDGKDEAAIRAAFGRFGTIVGVDFRSTMAVVRFATHDAALKAKQAGPPKGLCEGLDTEYNTRSYDGRRGDANGRDDDDGRGWCVLEGAVSTELLARLNAVPRTKEALDALKPKLLSLSSDLNQSASKGCWHHRHQRKPSSPSLRSQASSS